MAVFHTIGAPPSNGNTIRTNNGCTQNSNRALRKMVAVNRGNMAQPVLSFFLDMVYTKDR